jgi:hypothetical protein
MRQKVIELLKEAESIGSIRHSYYLMALALSYIAVAFADYFTGWRNKT